MRGFARPTIGHDSRFRRSFLSPFTDGRRAPSFAIALTLAITLAACAPAARQTAGGPLGMEMSSRPALFYGGEPTAIMAGETLQDFLRRRAPDALRSRDILSASRSSPLDPAIGVYIDGAFQGGIEVLPTILATDVIAVRRLHAAELSASMARHHSEGIIEIKLRR